MARRGASIHIDDSELRDLELDLRGAPLRIRRNMKEALLYAGRTISREMRIDAEGHQGNVFGRPGTEFTTPTPPVSSELVGPSTVEAGIENKGSGSLFHILAYGSVHNAPAYDPGAGPRRAMRRVENQIADKAESAVLGAHAGPR